jgi:tripartite-type tricarboxylate transporter receptor subunit TctC
VIEKLSASLQKALQDKNVVDRLAELGTAPVPADQATPAALEAKLKGEIDRWSPVIKAAGVYAD